MPVRRLPVRPDLEQLKHQAKDLLRAIKAGAAAALADLQEFHPSAIQPSAVRLADAQLVLTRWATSSPGTPTCSTKRR